MAITRRSLGASPGASSTSVVITKPINLAVGDFMLAHIVSKGVGAISPPANWTIIGARSDTASNSSALYWKIADAADAAATNFTFTVTSGRNRGEIMALLGVNPISPVASGNQQINGAGTTIAVPTDTVTDQFHVFLFASNAAGGTATTCTGTNPTCSIGSIGYAVAYSTYCALACFQGVKSGTGAIDAHAMGTFTSAVSSGHTVSLNPGVNYAKSINESVGAVDTQGKAADFIRIKLEDEGLTDTVTKIISFIRTLTENEGLTDLVISLKSTEELIDEILGLTDTVNRTTNFIRTLTENEELTDTVTKIINFIRTLTENEGLTDTVNRTTNFIRTVIDLFEITDEVLESGLKIFLVAWYVILRQNR